MFKQIIVFFLRFILPVFSRVEKDFDPARVKSFLAMETGGIGDILRLFPAIESLVDNFPKAKCCLLISPGSRELLDLFPRKNAVHKIIIFDMDGLHKGIFRKIPFLAGLRKNRFDLMYLPNRGMGMAQRYLMALFIAPTFLIGFSKNWIGKHNTAGVEFKYNVSILDQSLDILRASNLKVTRQEISLNVEIGGGLEFESIYKNAAPVIIVHPGVLWHVSHRAWPLEKYILLIHKLAKELEVNVVVIGSRAEIHVADLIEKRIGNTSFINLTGKTTIRQLCSLLMQSSVFVGNDSGPMHLAVALKVPTVAIFGSTSPEQVISHIDSNVHVVKSSQSCSPCYVHQYKKLPPCNDKQCLDSISVSHVFNGVKTLLAKKKQMIEV